MLKSPKTIGGQILRKAIALLVAYCFLATSSWSLNVSGSTLSRLTSPGWAVLASLLNPIPALAPSSEISHSLAGGSNQVKAAAKISTNWSGLHAAMTALQGNPPAVLAGDQAIESNIDSNSVGIAEAFPATATASGQVTSINVFVDAASAATQIYVGIYADSGGHPTTLLTQGNSTQLYPGTWNTFSVAPVNLTSGTPYWIAILGTTGGAPMFRDRNVTGCHSLTSSQSTLTSLPSSWATGQSWGTCFFSAYAVAGVSPATVLVGDQAVEASLDQNLAGRAEAFPAIANTTGTVGAVALYLDPTSGAGPVFTGLYADNNGHPGSLLGQGSTTQPVAGSWNQISITPSNITAGQKYWIAVLGTQATSPFFRDRLTNACNSETTPQTNLTSLPATWTTGTIWSTCYISAYGLPGAATGPVLSISTSNISFSASQGGANPAPAGLSVSNAGTGTLSFSAATDAPWLSVSPSSGTASQTLQVSVSLGTLAPGTYTGHVTVTAAGAQNSPAVATVTLTIASDVPPSITASTSPAPNANGWNNSNVTVTFTCAAGSFPIASCSPATVVSTEGGNQSICGTAVDTRGFSATACATVSLDRTAPIITGSVAPSPNAAGWSNTNVVVSYLCSDALSGVAVCPAPVTVATEGAAQNIGAVATDRAGNSSSVSTVLNIDKTPPVVTVTSAPPANGAGWNNSNVTVSFSCTDSLSGVAGCPAQQMVASEGQNQNISGVATDVAGNTTTGSVSLNIDKTPPSIVQLSTPDHVSALHGGVVSVTVNDNFTLAQVVISVNGTALGTFTSPPYQATLQVPAGSVPGDTLTVTAVATDVAGNTQTASRGVSVTANGVVVGQVLSDATGLPVQGASVQLISTTGQSDETDSRGRYSFQASDAHLFLSASNSGSTTVEREIFVQPGAGTVAIDARLTPLSTPSSIGSAGGSLNSGSISITVPPASVPNGTTFQLTPLSGQGLPGLLPLGWSPLAAFDLRASAPVTSLPTVVAKLPGTVLHLATYNPALHAWVLVVANLQSVNGSCSFSVPGPGDYALVTPDITTDPQIPVPDPGGPLTGVAVQAIDPAASSNGSLNPPMLPPAGGTAIATLGVKSPGFAPSGTIVQANISETFSLATKEVVSEQTRTEDIILYNALAPANSTMGAQFPVTPSHQYSLTQLVTGKVHLDILSGREGVRGQPGGNDPLTLSDGIATLSVPGGALNADTAISVQSTSLEDFVPTTGSMSAIQEVLVDFSGEILNTPAQLSIAASSLNPGDTFLLAQVQRINGVPHMAAVALAQINGTSLSSVSLPGLPGVTQGGEYVFYDISAPVGFAQGITSSSAGPVPALVLTDSLPIAAISGGDGHYIVPVLAGTANLTATAPNTSLAGTATVQVTAGLTVAANILLAGTVTTATVSPADGTLGVPASTIVSITTSAPLNPLSIVQTNLSLVKGSPSAPGAPVPLQPFILSTSGTTLTVSPVSNLDPATQYTIRVSGLADVSGGAVAVPTSTFTTKASAPLNFDPNAITFAFPDQNGNIHVSAPPGSLPPGSRILIVDQTNAVVFSLTALNDGSVAGDFLGTINDVLQVTVTDPLGASMTFICTQFVAPNGSVAVGTNGGTVTGPAGIAMIIPPGALDQPAVFSLQPLGIDAFPELPAVAGTSFGSGIQINSPAMPIFKKEIKFAFPKPADAPDGAFYYVYRQLVDQNNNYYFETLDHAFVQGEGSAAQVVMASPPFCGYRNSYRNFNTVANASFVPSVAASNNIFLMWDHISQTGQPGISSQGLIVGRALQTVPPGPGQTDATFVPMQGATIWIGSADTPSKNLSITSDSCGQFTIFDPQVGGGSRPVTAKATINGNDVILHATANEVNGVQVDDATYLVTQGLEQQYRNIGRVTFTFPPATPPPPPAQVDIRLYTLNATHSREFASGILTSGTPLVIAFKSSLSITGVAVGGRQLGVVPDYLDNPKDPQPVLDFRAVDAQSGDSLQRYVVGSPGPYTLTVTAVSPLGGPAITVSKSFLAVAAGGSNTTVTPGTQPQVIATIPMQNAKRISPGIFPEIIFSEPVTNVAENVSLTDADGNSPPFFVIGTRLDGTVANPVGASDVITALTVQPLTGLKFGKSYTLLLNAAIVDQNRPPLSLQPFTLQFTTTGTQELDQNTDRSALTHPVIIGDRLYAGMTVNSALSRLEVFDISDVINPIDKSASNPFAGRAADVAGVDSSPVTRCLTEVPSGQACPQQSQGGPLVAVAATIGATDFSIPSNIWFFDVSNPDQPVRVGAMSATTSATQDGSLMRIFMKGQFVYASTFNKGLQVIDAQQAITEYQQTPPDQFGGAITTEGNGFALDAVVNTIPVAIKEASGTIAPAVLYDVKAADYATGQPDPNAPSSTPVPTQTLIVATGTLPFVVADPQQGGIGALIYPARDISGTSLNQAPLHDGVSGEFALQQGRAVALGDIPVTDLLGSTTSMPIAVVVGTGTSTAGGAGAAPASLLAVVDMTNAKVPNPRGFVVLTDIAGSPVQPVDVILKDNLAVVGTSAKKVLLVNLDDPNRPTLAGEIDGVFGDRLALTDQGIIFTTSPNSAIGGVHSASLGSQCAAYRENLRNNSLPASPPQFSKDNHLEWTVSGGFSQPMEGVTGSKLNQDGLVLTNVMLGRRQMAQTMSLPYFQLSRSGSELRCHLLANSDDACTGVAPGVNARSHLLNYSAKLSPDASRYTYEAQFLVDYLDGNPDENPDVPDSCVLLTQTYEFYKEGLNPLEPFGHFPSAKFRPIVKYTYFTDSGSPVQMLTTAQRLHFDARTLNPLNQVPPLTASLKAPANGMMLACDPDPVRAPLTCLPGILDPNSESTLLGMFGGHNALQSETYASVIQNGQSAVVFDPLRNRNTIIDNIHQFPSPANNPDQMMDEPGATTFGCPACVHIHLRWSWVFNQQNITDLGTLIGGVAGILTLQPGALPVAQLISATIAANVLDPTFDNHNGFLNIPPNSPQNVDVAILRSGGAEEQHPSGTVQDLFKSHGAQLPFGQSILPSALGTQSTPVIWYVASSSLKSDTFFIHGGGFGTFYVNRVAFPAAGSGQALTLNVEHSRDVNYSVVPKRWDFILLPGTLAPTPVPLPPVTLSTVAGKLVGTDDINIPGPDTNPDLVFGGNTIRFTLDVSLDDPTLSPKHEWIRTFSFTQPEVQEP